MAGSATAIRSFSLSREQTWTPWSLAAPCGIGLIVAGVLPGSPQVRLASVGVFVLSAVLTWWAVRQNSRSWIRDLQLLVACLVPFALALEATPFYFEALLLYVAVGALMCDRNAAGITALIASIAFAAMSGLTWITLIQAAFIVGFAGIGFLPRKAGDGDSDRARRRLEEENGAAARQAAEFGLGSRVELTTGELGRGESQMRIQRHAVDAVNHSIYLSLSLLKTGLRCHTVVLLWFDRSNQYLQIKELVSDSDQISEDGISPAKGLVGGISRKREPLKLNGIRDGFRGIPYYTRTPKLRGFVGVPVLENGRLRGVICADRITDEPFDEDDVRLVEESASYLMRTIESERAFASIERSKYELGRFFEASRRFNTVLTTDAAIPVVFESVQQIAPYEFAAVTFFEEGRHTIGAVDTVPELEVQTGDWLGADFEDNQGLVAMAIRNRHYLPFGGVVRERTVLFTPEHDVPPAESLLVIPLVAQDSVVGTLVLGHSKANQFSSERREMIEVIANQFAVTYANAKLYEQMKEMATTDGLTGLANHRTFQARMDEAIARHRRNDQQLCLLLTDIDHFKKVNDTHGHPAGDEVLRQVAKCFEACLRETDIPCRYGGEEFAIILENTDVEGAIIIANRIRESIKELQFESDAGPFRCTLSIGVAGWPDDALDKQTLVDLADQALYSAKENGRDQVRAARQLVADAS